MTPQQSLTQTQMQSRPSLSLPKIRIISASPVPSHPTKAEPPFTSLEIDKDLETLQGTVQSTSEKRLSRKRSASVASYDSDSTSLHLSASDMGRSPVTPATTSDQDEDMTTPMPRQGSETSKRQSLSPPPKKNKHNAKDADWADVTDPEERRRIQNRIAQRKFREKARENKEKAERESRNQENAGNSYRVPLGNEINSEPELSGLPWGSVNLNHVVSKGHEAESRRSSGHGTYVGDESYSVGGNYCIAYGQDLHQAASYTSSGPEEPSYESMSYAYNPIMTLPVYPAA